MAQGLGDPAVINPLSNSVQQKTMRSNNNTFINTVQAIGSVVFFWYRPLTNCSVSQGLVGGCRGVGGREQVGGEKQALRSLQEALRENH